MKAMMTGFAVMILIGVGAYVILDGIGLSAEAVQSGSNVRLD